MQENDFEKNIQHRMDELQLYPSAEVWPEVERRIRKEKKRRWFIFWFLFPVLLTGAGVTIYFLTTTNKKISTSNRDEKQIEKPLVKKNNEKTMVNDQPATTIISKDSSGAKKDILPAPVASKDTKQKNIENNKTRQEKNDRPVISFEIDNGAKKKKVNSFDKVEDLPLRITKTENRVPADTIIKEQEPAKVAMKQEDIPVQVITDTTVRSNMQVNETNPVNDTVQADQAKPVVLTTDSNAVSDKPVPLVKTNKSKWHFGVTLITGLSNRAGGLNLGGEKSYSTAAPGGGGPAQIAIYSRHGNNNPGLFWETGAYIQSNSKKKTNVSFGLSVSSFAIRQPTGSFADSAISADASGFYRSGHSFLYTDRYYYLQVPVMFHWQVNKGNRFPLIWQNGFSPSFLLGSNALIYDPSRDIFYQDKTSLNKVQLAFRSGLYSKFGTASKHPFSAGLFFNYNFSGLQKKYQYGRNHLLSFGVQLMMQLKKN
jgi:hypothetical protein